LVNKVLEEKKNGELKKVIDNLVKVREKHWELKRKLYDHIDNIDDSEKKTYRLEHQCRFIMGKRKGEKCSVHKINAQEITNRKQKKQTIVQHACGCSTYLHWEMPYDFYLRCNQCKIPPKERVQRATFTRAFTNDR